MGGKVANYFRVEVANKQAILDTVCRLETKPRAQCGSCLPADFPPAESCLRLNLDIPVRYAILSLTQPHSNNYVCLDVHFIGAALAVSSCAYLTCLE